MRFLLKGITLPYIKFTLFISLVRGEYSFLK